MQTHGSDTQTNELIEYTLSSILTIENANALAQDLRKNIVDNTSHIDLLIHAQQVEVITTPGVQMVIALGKLLERHGRRFIIANPSPALTQAFENLGLGNLLVKWGQLNA